MLDRLRLGTLISLVVLAVSLTGAAVASAHHLHFTRKAYTLRQGKHAIEKFEAANGFSVSVGDCHWLYPDWRNHSQEECRATAGANADGLAFGWSDVTGWRHHRPTVIATQLGF